MNSAGRGRGGKFQKPKRGGGKHFSRDLQPLNADGEIENMWAPRDAKVDEDEESSEEESSEEEEDESDEDAGSTKPQTREERKAAARARKDAAIAKAKGLQAAAPGDLPPNSSDEESDAEMPANPNHSASARSQVTGKADSGTEQRDGKELSRREREALQAQQAKERYAKLHAEGKTDEAKADLARLKLVRERREAEAARKKAEAEEKVEQEKARAEQLEREAKLRAAAAGRGGRGGKKKK